MRDCPARDAWSDSMAQPIEWNLFLQLHGNLGLLRARTDDTHLAAQDIPKLWHFV